MDNELKLVAETDNVLWSVRTGGAVFLVVRNTAGFDVHTVADGGVEYLGDVETHQSALALIEGELAS